jgi:hypothetical protein
MKVIAWILLGLHFGYTFYPWNNLATCMSGQLGLIFLMLWYRWAYDIELFGKEEK